MKAVVNTAALRADDYKRFLQGTDDWASVLHTIVENGMAVAWGQLGASPSPPEKAAVETAIGSMTTAISPRR